MFLTKDQADVVANLVNMYEADVVIEPTNMENVICAQLVEQVPYKGVSEYQYLIGTGASAGILRIGGPEGMVSVDRSDFHASGTSGCECQDAHGESCPRHGSPGDRRE